MIEMIETGILGEGDIDISNFSLARCHVRAWLYKPEQQAYTYPRTTSMVSLRNDFEHNGSNELTNPFVIHGTSESDFDL
jgi:hypothetical protein